MKQLVIFLILTSCGHFLETPDRKEVIFCYSRGIHMLPGEKRFFRPHEVHTYKHIIHPTHATYFRDQENFKWEITGEDAGAKMQVVFRQKYKKKEKFWSYEYTAPQSTGNHTVTIFSTQSSAKQICPIIVMDEKMHKQYLREQAYKKRKEQLYDQRMKQKHKRNRVKNGRLP